MYEGRSLWAVQHKVANEKLRPIISETPQSEKEASFVQLMAACWAEDVKSRPTFMQILKKLKSFRNEY